MLPFNYETSLKWPLKVLECIAKPLFPLGKILMIFSLDTLLSGSCLLLQVRGKDTALNVAEY
jgi:hypothetical protein